MDPATLISGGLGIVGGIINRMGQKSRDERLNQYNIDMQNRRNQQNIDFWNMQNTYNHPAAQMQRMQEAGLNPAMMYGKGQTASTGNAGAIAPANAPQMHASNLGAKLLGGMNQYADIELKKEQSNQVRALADKTTMETSMIGLKKIQQSFDNITATWGSEIKRLEAKRLKQEGRKSEYQAEQEFNLMKRSDTELNAFLTLREKEGLKPWIDAERAKLKFWFENTKNIRLRNELLNLNAKYYTVERLYIPGANAAGNIVRSVGSWFGGGKFGKMGSRALGQNIGMKAYRKKQMNVRDFPRMSWEQAF